MASEREIARRDRLKRIAVAVVCFGLCVLAAGSAGEPKPAAAPQAEAGRDNLRFKPAGDGEFEFNTGVLSGKLRAGGKSLGLLPVVQVASGATLTRSMGFFGHYRVFSANHRYGSGAWYWPSEGRLREDGSVETHWPSAEDRPFEMWAVYRWASPATFDVETRVRPQVELPDFEVFLASYFSEPFTESLVYVQGRPGSEDKARFLPAEESNGIWQMFPRDPGALRLIRDGRWKFAPNPVDWVIMPMLAEPIALRRDSRSATTAILMAPPRECFAVATPHQTEGHRAMYFSLFGSTLKAGETSRARARLVIAASAGEAQILDLYRAYLDELPGLSSRRGF